MALLGLALRRLALSLPTLFIILVGLFLLLQLAPGDTVDITVNRDGKEVVLKTTLSAYPGGN